LARPLGGRGALARLLEQHGDLCSDTAELHFSSLRMPTENMLDHVRTRQAFGGTLWNVQSHSTEVVDAGHQGGRCPPPHLRRSTAQGRGQGLCVRENSMAKIYACEADVKSGKATCTSMAAALPN